MVIGLVSRTFLNKESMLPKDTRLESIRYANHTKKENALALQEWKTI